MNKDLKGNPEPTNLSWSYIFVPKICIHNLLTQIFTTNEQHANLDACTWHSSRNTYESLLFFISQEVLHSWCTVSQWVSLYFLPLPLAATFLRWAIFLAEALPLGGAGNGVLIWNTHHRQLKFMHHTTWPSLANTFSYCCHTPWSIFFVWKMKQLILDTNIIKDLRDIIKDCTDDKMHLADNKRYSRKLIRVG